MLDTRSLSALAPLALISCKPIHGGVLEPAGGDTGSGSGSHVALPPPLQYW